MTFLSVNFRKRMKVISIQDRFYANFFRLQNQSHGPHNSQKDAKQQAISEHAEQCYLAKKGACGFCKWNDSNSHLCMASVEFFEQAVYIKYHKTAFRRKKCFFLNSLKIWYYLAQFLLIVLRSVKAKEVWGERKSAVCRHNNNWCKYWDIKTRQGDEVTDVISPHPKQFFF